MLNRQILIPGGENARNKWRHHCQDAGVGSCPGKNHRLLQGDVIFVFQAYLKVYCIPHLLTFFFFFFFRTPQVLLSTGCWFPPWWKLLGCLKEVQILQGCGFCQYAELVAALDLCRYILVFVAVSLPWGPCSHFSSSFLVQLKVKEQLDKLCFDYPNGCFVWEGGRD